MNRLRNLVSNLHKIIFTSLVLLSGALLTYFLFEDDLFLYNDNSSGLKTFSYISSNKSLAPKLGMDFPAHNTDNSKTCLNCHGIAIAKSKLGTMNSQFKKMGFEEIPVIPHEHKFDLDRNGVNDFNCLFCHKPDWAK